MSDDIKELLKEIESVFDMMNYPTLKNAIRGFLAEEVDIKETISLIKNHKLSDIQKDGDVLSYVDFVKVGEKNISINSMTGAIEKKQFYHYGNNCYRYTIIIKTFGGMEYVYFSTEKERDEEFQKLVDILSVLKKFKFN